jgi:pyrroline-5-carboxylate reductase
VAKLSDVIFICVRPLEVRDVISDVVYLLTSQKLVVSVAVDVSLEKLQALCPARLARAFPGMASEKLQGVTLLAFGYNTTAEDKRLIADLFHAIGHVVPAEEKDFTGLIKSVATIGGITEAGVLVIQREAPGVFDQLFQATEARHQQVRTEVDAQG